MMLNLGPVEEELREFPAWCRTRLETALKVMSVEKGDPMPAAFLREFKGQETLAALPEFSELESPEKRNLYLEQFGRMCAQRGLKVIFFSLVHLGWQTTMPATECPLVPLAPSKDKDREEVLLFSGSTIKMERAFAWIKTGRNNKEPEKEATHYPALEEIKLTFPKEEKLIESFSVSFWAGFLGESAARLGIRQD